MTQTQTLEKFSFERLTSANIERCKRWHPKGLEDWSSQRWFLATLGEMGETANAMKKLWRIEAEMANISEPERQISTKAHALKVIAAEIADTVIYLNLYATRTKRKLNMDPNIHLIADMTPEDYLEFAAKNLCNNAVATCLWHLQRLALSLEIDFAKAITDKFNETSIKYGFPERI